MPGDPVVLTLVPNQSEAELLCSALRDSGIRCYWRGADSVAGALAAGAASGPCDVLVDPEDLEAARAFLADGDQK